MKNRTFKKEWKWILCAVVLLQLVQPEVFSVKAEHLPLLKKTATPSDAFREPSVALPAEDPDISGGPDGTEENGGLTQGTGQLELP